MKAEQKIQKAIVDFLESIGAYVVKVISATKKGILDIIACIDGKFITIEVKRPETKDNVSALQQYNINQAQKAGGIAFVAWNVEMVKKILQLNQLI